MKILVAHPAQQHSFRTAVALKKNEMLFKYATTVYNKPYSLTSITTKVLRGKLQAKATARMSKELENKDVILFDEIGGLAKLFALHVPFAKKYYLKIKYRTADKFAKKVARYAIKNNVDMVITYDDCSPLLFEILKKEAPEIVRVMDVSIANLFYMRKIFDDDMKKKPEFAYRLKNEMPYVWNKENSDRALREIKATQYFLVPSDFVKKSLLYSEVRSEQCLLCPYGVDITEFNQKKYYRNVEERKEPLQFIFVGGVKERKGISYLLEAFKRIPKDKAQLTIVGAVNKEDKDIQPYFQYVNFTGMVLHSEVPNILRKADVYVFPSLAEGMTLSALEAAACGLPLILTENTGTNDCMTNGIEGFIIPIQSSDAIVEKVTWFIEHPERIEEMGNAARKMAERFTWDAYSECLVELVKNIHK